MIETTSFSLKIYTENKPLDRLLKMCNPFFHELRVIPPANGFRLVCYTATLFLFITEVVCSRVDPDWRLAHLSSRRRARGPCFNEGSLQ